MAAHDRADEGGDRLSAEEPAGFTQVPDSLLLSTAPAVGVGPDGQEQAVAPISDGAYRMYALLRHVARQNKSAFAGRPYLARKLGLKSVRSVDSRVAELRTHGYLKVTPRWRPNGGGQSSNDYYLFFYPRPDLTDPDGPLGRAASSGRENPVSPVSPVSPAPATPKSPTEQGPGTGAETGAETGAGTSPEALGTAGSRPPGASGAAAAREAVRQGRKNLHGAKGATSRRGSAQEAAPHRSRSSLDTSTPLPDPSAATSRTARPRDASGTGEDRPDSNTGRGVTGGVAALRRDRDRSVTAALPEPAGAVSAELETFVGAVLDVLPDVLVPRTRREQTDLAAVLKSALEQGWRAPDLVDALLAGRTLPAVVTHPVGLLRTRFLELAPPRRRPTPPPWCGDCDPTTRLVDLGTSVARCLHCHPLTQGKSH